MRGVKSRQTAPDVGIKEKWVRCLADAEHTAAWRASRGFSPTGERMVEICQALNKNGKTGHMTSSGYTWAEQGINSRVLWLQFIKRSKRWGVESRRLNCPMNDSQGRLASSRYITRCTVESCALQIFHSSTMLHSLIRLQYKTSINPPTSASDIEIPTPSHHANPSIQDIRLSP